MTVLWIPTENSLHFYREMLYALCGACSINEYYNFLQSRYVPVYCIMHHPSGVSLPVAVNAVLMMYKFHVPISRIPIM